MYYCQELFIVCFMFWGCLSHSLRNIDFSKGFKMSDFVNIILVGGGLVFFLGLAVTAMSSGFKSVDDNYRDIEVDVTNY